MADHYCLPWTLFTNENFACYFLGYLFGLYLLKQDFLFHKDYKPNLCRLYRQFFEASFCGNCLCTWRVLYECTNYKEVKKIIFLVELNNSNWGLRQLWTLCESLYYYYDHCLPLLIKIVKAFGQNPEVCKSPV